MKAGQAAQAELKAEIAESKTGWDRWVGEHNLEEMIFFEELAQAKIASTSP